MTRTIARVGQTKGLLLTENLVAVVVYSMEVQGVSRLMVGHIITHKKTSLVNGQFSHPAHLITLNSQLIILTMGSMADLLASEIT